MLWLWFEYQVSFYSPTSVIAGRYTFSQENGFLFALVLVLRAYSKIFSRTGISFKQLGGRLMYSLQRHTGENIASLYTVENFWHWLNFEAVEDQAKL